MLYSPTGAPLSASNYRLSADFRGSNAEQTAQPGLLSKDVQAHQILVGPILVRPRSGAGIAWRMITLIASLLAIGLQTTPDAYQLNRQGRELLEHRRYSAAVEIFRRAVDRAESDFGPADPATAMIRRNLALAYVQTRDLESAEKAAKLALSAMESRFGPADPGMTPILNVLVECYASAGRTDDAGRVSERAVAIGPSAGVHFGIALHNLGALREFSGDAAGAASYYRRAIAVKTEMLGAAHPHVQMSRAALRRVEHGQLTKVNQKRPLISSWAGE